MDYLILVLILFTLINEISITKEGMLKQNPNITKEMEIGLAMMKNS
jgi:hypothetical protein